MGEYGSNRKAEVDQNQSSDSNHVSDSSIETQETRSRRNSMQPVSTEKFRMPEMTRHKSESTTLEHDDTPPPSSHGTHNLETPEHVTTQAPNSVRWQLTDIQDSDLMIERIS